MRRQHRETSRPPPIDIHDKGAVIERFSWTSSGVKWDK